MKISVFGLGYVGAVSAACFTRAGHEVLGIDPVQTKVDMINRGQAPIIEAEVGEMMASAFEKGRLRATKDAAEAIAWADLALVCVGTPSESNGSLDLRYVRHVAEQIGNGFAKRDDHPVVVFRSTMLPGTMDQVVIPILEQHSGKTAGKDFGVCFNPEFLREGSAVYDFYNPPKTVIGTIAGDTADLVASLYEGLPGPLIRTSLQVAEMVKYTDNTWHALKVSFGNEIGTICKALGIDGHAVMDIFCQDEKLNISKTYLKPGFAFGGSCLPKDVRALTYRARTLDLQLPLLGSIMESNRLHVERGLALIQAKKNKKVGFLGFSFKAGTDDLRESPLVELIERLLGKGYEIRLFDENVRLASLVGANREYLLNRIPHISSLLQERVEDVLDHAETLVIGNGDPAFREIPSRLRPDQVLVDLVRIAAEPPAVEGYDGICW